MSEEIARRLERAITTATNDDYSEPGTEKRARHVERLETMRDALDALSQHGDATGAYSNPDEETQMRLASEQDRAPREPFTATDAWDELLNKDDRNSPEEYPDHCLITADELRDFIDRARHTPQPDPVAAEREACAKALEPFASAIEKAESAKVGWDGLSDDVLFGLRHFTFGDLRRASKALAAIRSRSTP